MRDQLFNLIAGEIVYEVDKQVTEFESLLRVYAFNLSPSIAPPLVHLKGVVSALSYKRADEFASGHKKEWYISSGQGEHE